MYTSLILEKAALGQPYAIDVDERAAIPVCYAPDAARALATLATATQTPRGTYNIGTCRATARGLVDLARRAYPKAILEFHPDPALATVARATSTWQLSVDAAAQDLSWQPAFTLESMAQDLMATVGAVAPNH
jgi:nucleoside-diphosphate-sugar epimerase